MPSRSRYAQSSRICSSPRWTVIRLRSNPSETMTRIISDPAAPDDKPEESSASTTTALPDCGATRVLATGSIRDALQAHRLSLAWRSSHLVDAHLAAGQDDLRECARMLVESQV
jgi:hypothetical protein